MRVSSIDKLVTNQTISSSGNSRSFKGQWTDQLLAYIKVGGVSGTNTPTMTVTVQSSPNNVDWHNLSDNVAITAAGNHVVGSTNFGTFYRLAWVLTGTNPSFTGVDISLQTKGD